MSAEPVAAGTTAGQEELKRRGIRPWPVPDDVTAPFWQAAADHRLVLPRCTGCDHWRWPVSLPCRHCGADPVVWVPASGRGTVYSFIVDHRNLVPGFDGAYVVAQVVPAEVDDDSVRLTTNLPGCPPGDVRTGMPVVAVYESVRPDVTLVQFVPDPAPDHRR